MSKQSLKKSEKTPINLIVHFKNGERPARLHGITEYGIELRGEQKAYVFRNSSGIRAEYLKTNVKEVNLCLECR